MGCVAKVVAVAQSFPPIVPRRAPPFHGYHAWSIVCVRYENDVMLKDIAEQTECESSPMADLIGTRRLVLLASKAGAGKLYPSFLRGQTSLQRSHMGLSAEPLVKTVRVLSCVHAP